MVARAAVGLVTYMKGAIWVAVIPSPTARGRRPTAVHGPPVEALHRRSDNAVPSQAINGTRHLFSADPIGLLAGPMGPSERYETPVSLVWTTGSAVADADVEMAEAPRQLVRPQAPRMAL